MFFVDKPYVSDFLKATIKDHNIPVVHTPAIDDINLHDGTRILSPDEAITLANRPDAPPIYMNSENAIGWLAQHSIFAPLSAQITLFKNKIKFRELTQTLYPDFVFKAVAINDIADLDYDTLPCPFIIKPAIGFFSMGVYRVTNREDWTKTQAAILKEMEEVKNLYPAQVMDSGMFIIEQCIEGEEYAVDAYFDADGTPVILGILKHAFSSDDDVSDRVYMSSKSIIEDNIADFTKFLADIGKLSGVTKFPVHVELRKDANGTILPIEVNPMRFGGWCTTADLTAKAYGFNPYTMYFNQEKPDWDKALAGKDGKLYCLIVLDNSTGIDTKDIQSFDYDAMLAGFEKPLELRKIDFSTYPVFGFVMTETRTNNYAELQTILNSDLSEFVVKA